MRLALVAIGISISSTAFAQDGPGGPKIFDELDAMTSTTSTLTPDIEPPKKQVIDKRRGILGINVVNLGGQVRVKSLKPGGAAERAGIAKWDTILSIDGKKVKDRLGYVELMAGKRAGEQVTIQWKAANGAIKSNTIVLEGGRRAVATQIEEDDSDRPVKKKRRIVRRKKKPRTRKWYGWQGIASDVPSIVLMLVGLMTDQNIVSGLGLVGYGIGPPITHFFHDNVGRGMISMALRVAIPALTVLGTLGICDEASVCDDATPLVVVGGLATFLAIPAIDAAAISWQKLEPPRETSVNISLAPAIGPTTEGGMTFGLQGAF